MPCTRTCKLVHPFHPWASCVDSATVKIDKKLKRNMDLATDVYLSPADGSPCGEITIRLFKGADSSERQRIRPYLIQYLKGSNIQREALQAGQPAFYTYYRHSETTT